MDLFCSKTTEQHLTPEPFKFPWRPRWVQHSAVLSDSQSSTSKICEERTGDGFDAAAVPRERGQGRRCLLSCSQKQSPAWAPWVLFKSLLFLPAPPVAAHNRWEHQMLLLSSSVVGQRILPMPLLRSVPYCTLAFKIHCMPSAFFFSLQLKFLLVYDARL